MTKWLRIIKKTLHELLTVHEEGKGGMLEEMVLGIADMDVKTRLTGPKLLQFMED